MEAEGSSETLVMMYQATLRHIPENNNLHSRWKDPKTLLSLLSFFTFLIQPFPVYLFPPVLPVKEWLLNCKPAPCGAPDLVGKLRTKTELITIFKMS
jgi:hypothetical protein